MLCYERDFLMSKNILFNKNPMRIFEKGIHGGLGKGNLGVFMSRAGVGKTACLIQISLYNLFRGNKVLYITIGQRVDEVRDWYNEILETITQFNNLEDMERLREEIESRRIILSYTDRVFNLFRLHKSLERLRQQGNFAPDLIFIDGFSFDSITREEFEKFKEIAFDNTVGIWFSAQTHREGLITNERGIPSPCHNIDDILSVIIFLEPLEDSVRLRLLKGHENTNLQDLHLILDLKTFLIKDDTL